MKSFFLPVGRSAAASLTTVLSALSCGAALPVADLDILHIADRETDPVIPSLIRDLNQMHSLLSREGNASLFPSAFQYESFRPQLPSVLSLSEDPASAALLDALRGKGIPEVNGYGTGDYLVYVQVYIPKRLDRKEKEIVESWRNSSSFTPKG